MQETLYLYFLISLKAGGVGLNLAGADVVIHYDPWWNQAVQNQATDRAHRIGQTKKVTVYKLIAKGSIEEKIQKLQETQERSGGPDHRWRICTAWKHVQRGYAGAVGCEIKYKISCRITEAFLNRI